MVWQSEVEEIQRRQQIAHALGGEEAVARHHAAGKQTVRERIDGILDPSTFREMGVLSAAAEYDDDGNLVKITPSNSVLGIGRIDGRQIVVGGEDFTIRGGASDGGGSAKMYYMEHLARQQRIPLIRLIEGAGGSVRTNASRHSGQAIVGGQVSPYVDLLGTVPVVSAALGSVAGLPAARMAFAHFSIMVREAVVFAGGPPVVERALGVQVTKEELGGVQVHAYKSGLVDNVATDEADCIRQIKTFLSYLPSNVWEAPPRLVPCDDPNRRDEGLLSIIPRNRRRTYDARTLIRHVVDLDSFFELTPYFGQSLITGLARVDGYPVAVLANNPNHVGGSLDGPGSDKLTRFVDLCDTFHLPVVSFEDEPGYMVGPAAEASGTLRRGVRALAAVMQSTVPWVNFIVRRAYGVAAGAHLNGNALRYAWPSGEWGSIPVEGGVAAAYRREIESAPDPEQRRAEIEARHDRDRNPFRRAEAFGLHDLIDPRETRPVMVDFVRMAQKVIETSLGPKPRLMRP
ncbi:MAG: acyl-CoA carboxylase subunit beta [Dehalococcoidia bacterium]